MTVMLTLSVWITREVTIVCALLALVGMERRDNAQVITISL